MRLLSGHVQSQYSIQLCIPVCEVPELQGSECSAGQDFVLTALVTFLFKLLFLGCKIVILKHYIFMMALS